MSSMKKIIFIVSIFYFYNCFAFNYGIKTLRLNNRLLKTNILELNCEKNNDGKCVCPGNCFTLDNSTKKCNAINCWKWNSIEEKCERTGKEWLPAIILQGIPITGVFGSGFGNMGRWDIFGIYMGLVFGSCIFVCLLGCCCLVFNNSEDKEEKIKITISCCNCLWSCVLLGFWIWGVVVIANKKIEAPWTNWDGKSIMCPLI